MVNKDRIMRMGTRELAEFLRDFGEICPYPAYADVEAWLLSEDSAMPWKGEDVTFRGRAAKKVNERVICGALYDVLIQDGTMVTVPRLPGKGAV